MLISHNAAGTLPKLSAASREGGNNLLLPGYIRSFPADPTEPCAELFEGHRRPLFGCRCHDQINDLAGDRFSAQRARAGFVIHGLQCSLLDVTDTPLSTHDRHTTARTSSPRMVTRPPVRKSLPQRSQPRAAAASISVISTPSYRLMVPPDRSCPTSSYHSLCAGRSTSTVPVHHSAQSSEESIMTDHFNQPSQAASAGNAPAHDADGSVREIDDLIVQIRVAYDAGATIKEIHAAIAGIVEPAMTVADGVQITPSAEDTGTEPASSAPRLGSEMWQPIRPSDSVGCASDDTSESPRQSPRGASNLPHNPIGLLSLGSLLGMPARQAACAQIAGAMAVCGAACSHLSVAERRIRSGPASAAPGCLTGDCSSY